MNIDVTPVIIWLSQIRNALFATITASAIMGTLYWAPNVYGQKRIVLIKLTQYLFTGIVGGLSVSISIIITGIPFALIFRPSIYTKIHQNESAFDFIRLLFTSLPFSTLLKGFPQLFIGSFIIGLLLGLCIGILSGGVPRFKSSQIKHLSSLTLTQSHLSRHNFISWCILGTSIGLAFGNIFGPIIGVLAGFFLGLSAFLLGLHPRPAQVSVISKKAIAVNRLRVLGFWIIIALAAVLVLTHFAQLILAQPIISTFLILVLLLYFGLLIYRERKIAQQGFTPRVSSERDEQGIYRRTERLVTSPRRYRGAFVMGITCGILLFGVAFGLPVSLFLGGILGIGAGIVVEVIFSILGLGLGSAYGLMFICAYALGPIIAFRIERASDEMLVRVGVSLVILSFILGIWLYFIR